MTDLVKPTLQSVRNSLGVDTCDPRLDESLQGCVDAAFEIVKQYAPAAPQSVANEAVYRLTGALYDNIYSHGPAHDVSNNKLFARTGARGLLSPWVRRTGLICGAE